MFLTNENALNKFGCVFYIFFHKRPLLTLKSRYVNDITLMIKDKKVNDINYNFYSDLN